MTKKAKIQLHRHLTTKLKLWWKSPAGDSNMHNWVGALEFPSLAPAHRGCLCLWTVLSMALGLSCHFS